MPRLLSLSHITGFSGFKVSTEIGRRLFSSRRDSDSFHATDVVQCYHRWWRADSVGLPELTLHSDCSIPSGSAENIQQWLQEMAKHKHMVARGSLLTLRVSLPSRPFPILPHRQALFAPQVLQTIHFSLMAPRYIGSSHTDRYPQGSRNGTTQQYPMNNMCLLRTKGLQGVMPSSGMCTSRTQRCVKRVTPERTRITAGSRDEQVGILRPLQ